MERSVFLSKVIGIYLLVVSLFMLMHMPVFLVRLHILLFNPSLLFAMGFVTLILGILMIVGHSVWEFNWRGLITLCGWLVFVKGALCIMCPECIAYFAFQIVNHINAAYASAFIDLLLALIFCYYGFRSTAAKR